MRYQIDGKEHTLECDFIAGCDGFHGSAARASHRSTAQRFERVYPFAWLGILAEVPPASEELIYANDDGVCAAQHALADRQPLYLQCPPEEDLDQWSDERIWDELRARLHVQVPGGPVLQKSVTPMRSFVAEPMRFGRLFLAGDAAHIVPPTGAKGMNLAIADVQVLAQGLEAFYRAGSNGGAWTRTPDCLSRVWKVQRFSWWMTSLLHRFDDETPLTNAGNLPSSSTSSPPAPPPRPWPRTTSDCRFPLPHWPREPGLTPAEACRLHQLCRGKVARRPW